MKKIICALLILCSSLFSEELISLHVNGPKEGRVNIVFLAEGYTRYQQDRFIEDMNTFFEAIIQFEPLSHYERYINVYGIWAESPSQGIGGYYGSYQWPDIERLLVADNELVYNSISELIPEADIPVVIINSEIYGGSGGEIAVATSGAPEIVAHEIGHSFASLGDEYEYETPGQKPMEMPNVTHVTNRAGVKWNYWIQAATPLPTPEEPFYDQRVGLFEGAMYSPEEWYRPMNSCQMRSNGVPLCKVCAEQYIKTIYEYVSPIDYIITDTTETISIVSNQPTDIRIQPMQLMGENQLRINWYVDNQRVQSQTSETFNSRLTTGLHKVTAIVTDTTPFVRSDDLELLKESVEWTVMVQNADASGCHSPTQNNLIKNEQFCYGMAFWESLNLYRGEIIDGEFVIDIGKDSEVYHGNLNYFLPLNTALDYQLEFRAKASRRRAIVVGLGINSEPWSSNYETMMLTTEWETYTVTLKPTATDANSRLFFDMGEFSGKVYLDDIILTDGTQHKAIVRNSAALTEDTTAFDYTPPGSDESSSDITHSLSSAATTLPLSVAIETVTPDEKQNSDALSPIRYTKPSQNAIFITKEALTLRKEHNVATAIIYSVNGSKIMSLSLGRELTTYSLSSLSLNTGVYCVTLGSNKKTFTIE